MARVGFVGLGDMGLGMASNLVAAGFPVVAHDLRRERLDAFAETGGSRSSSLSELAACADVVVVMVFDGEQALAVVEALAPRLAPGSAIVLTATVMPAEARSAAATAAAGGIGFVDSPVTGGQSGARAGTLTLMAAAPAAVLEQCRPVMAAMSGAIFHVGEEPGTGQAVKAALQAAQGPIYAGLFEAVVLARKSGVPLSVLADVLRASVVGSTIIDNALAFIEARRFVGTGARIATMEKDLRIAMELARAVGAPMFAAAAARQLFAAGLSAFPEADNWTIVRLLERLAAMDAD